VQNKEKGRYMTNDEYLRNLLDLLLKEMSAIINERNKQLNELKNRIDKINKELNNE
jgi:Arc/MetJ-type ribon-helix-helix transcriptional regulator